MLCKTQLVRENIYSPHSYNGNIALYIIAERVDGEEKENFIGVYISTRKKLPYFDEQRGRVLHCGDATFLFGMHFTMSDCINVYIFQVSCWVGGSVILNFFFLPFCRVLLTRNWAKW